MKEVFENYTASDSDPITIEFNIDGNLMKSTFFNSKLISVIYLVVLKQELFAQDKLLLIEKRELPSEIPEVDRRIWNWDTTKFFAQPIKPNEKNYMVHIERYDVKKLKEWIFDNFLG